METYTLDAEQLAALRSLQAALADYGHMSFDDRLRLAEKLSALLAELAQQVVPETMETGEAKGDTQP